jgi:hypothetical protein
MTTTQRKTSPSTAAKSATSYPDTPEGRRARRAAALAKAAGIWKDRTDIPKDGLEYQRMMREEWR